MIPYLKYLKFLPYALIVLGVAGFCAKDRHDASESGKREIKLEQAQRSEREAVASSQFYAHKADSALKASNAKDSVLRERTKSAQMAASKYQTIRDSLKHDEGITDDAIDMLDDALSAPLRQIIGKYQRALGAADSALLAAKKSSDAADSLIATQRSVIANQQSELSAKDSIEIALRKQNKVLKAAIPGRTSKLLTAVKWASVGAGVLAVVKR